jgi:hypothetical protein
MKRLKRHMIQFAATYNFFAKEYVGVKHIN